MKTQLKNRVLYFDGTSEVTSELVPELFLMGLSPSQIVVAEPDEDIRLFNLLDEDLIASEKMQVAKPDLTWKIPEHYKELDLYQYTMRSIAGQHVGDRSWLAPRIIENRREEYIARAKEELQEIKWRDMELLVRTLIYVVDVLRQSGTVWGVGRGSSCASLVLYLIGLHKVDPVAFSIPLTEFFHN